MNRTAGRESGRAPFPEGREEKEYRNSSCKGKRSAGMPTVNAQSQESQIGVGGDTRGSSGGGRMKGKETINPVREVTP